MRTARLLGSRSVFAVSGAAAALALAVVVPAASLALTGCGGDGNTHVAKIAPGEMPSGETWTGVYFHPVYGYLHMVANENNIVAKWKRADQSAWGELSGVASGNVLHFQWKEHKYGLVGPAAESKGKGYFVYKMGGEKIAELDGQFGVDTDETGADWHNIKQVRMVPDLNSIKGDTTAAQPAAKDSWQ